MKLLLLLAMSVCSHACAMKKADAPDDGALLVRPISIMLRSRPDNSQTIQKTVYIPVQPPKSQAGVVCGVPESIGNNLLATLRAVQQSHENESAGDALKIFMEMMFNTGDESEKPTAPGMERLNTEMYDFLKAKESKFIFSPESKQLLLHEDLGAYVHAGGWAFDKIMEVNLTNMHQIPVPQLTIQYHHMQMNVHGKVSLADLVAGSNKQCVEKFEALKFDVSKNEDEKHKAEVALIVAMSLAYINSLPKAH